MFLFRMQTWRKPFTDLAIVWMEVLIQQVNDWTLEAINADQVFASLQLIA